MTMLYWNLCYQGTALYMFSYKIWLESSHFRCVACLAIFTIRENKRCFSDCMDAGCTFVICTQQNQVFSPRDLQVKQFHQENKNTVWLERHNNSSSWHQNNTMWILSINLEKSSRNLWLFISDSKFLCTYIISDNYAGLTIIMSPEVDNRQLYSLHAG